MILIDVNEPRFYEIKLKAEGIQVRRERIEFCDYIVKVRDLEVAVERKEINDYLSSIIDGRLFRQLYLMSYHYPFSYLVVVGYVSLALRLHYT